MDFNTFAAKVREARKVNAFAGTLLALDPGETTGWSVWQCTPGEDDVLIAWGQLPSWPMNLIASGFLELLKQYKPTRVVYEQYRVYDWKLETHSWSDVPTLRIIGSIETRLIDANIPYSHQTAQVAKQFVTDQRLKEFGFYKPALKHARDSIRHGIYYLCFGTQSTQV